MKIISLALMGILFLTLSSAHGSDAETSQKLLYVNAGDTTDGFLLAYGNLSFSVDQHVLIGASGGGWDKLPVLLKGDFQVDFDVYGDSNDVDSNILFVDELNGEGIEVNNCPQDTDTPTLGIKYSTHLCDHEGYYFDQTTLVSAASTKFPNRTWTHVTITKKGNILTDNVGGQVISTSVENENFPAAARLGLGYYSTQNLGGNGLIRYAHIRVVQLLNEGSAPAPSSEKTSSPAVKPAAQNWD